MDLVIGTAGHIDHGKTALVKALTGVDADRLPEEKKRGITIDLGFADFDLGDVRISFVDVPGHERFVKNMLAGASGIDLVLFIIAADEGVMPQTREHFDICRLLGVRSGIIVLTKSDLVDPETLELAVLDAKELVSESFLENAPMIAASSVNGKGLGDLKDAIRQTAKTFAKTADLHTLLFPIDRSFAVKGFGTVVTGTLVSGELKAGDKLELLPQGKEVRVRGLQSHNAVVTSAGRGRRVAVNLGGVDHKAVERGMTLSQPGVLRTTQSADVSLEIVPGATRPLRSRQRVRAHIGTAEVIARIQVLGNAEIAPGAFSFAQIRFESPVVTRLGQRFVIRSYSPQITIGGGRILDPFAERHRKKDHAAIQAILRRLDRPDATEMHIVNAFTELAGRRGTTMSDLQARSGWRDDVLKRAVEAALADGGSIRAGETLFPAADLAEIEASLIKRLEKHHSADSMSKGMPRETLRGPNLSTDVFEALLARLTAASRIEVAGDTVSLPARSSVFSPEEQLVRERIMTLLTEAGLQVPKSVEVLREAATGTKVDIGRTSKIAELLIDSGDAVRVSDDFLFARSAIDELIDRMRDLATRSSDHTIDVARFKELAGVSRKYAIPLLEYFDREKITLRVGDSRVIR
ncbi:MAG: selenocysteine-specific translation elongation factor [Pyrinomonadaceae bacterium]